jgi:hypothetical protein
MRHMRQLIFILVDYLHRPLSIQRRLSYGANAVLPRVILPGVDLYLVAPELTG